MLSKFWGPKPANRWKDNLEINFKENCQCDKLYWFDLQWGLLERPCEPGVELSGSM